MNLIESKDNTLIKYLRKLRKKKYRVQEEKFLVEGFRFVEEAIKSTFQVSHVLIAESAIEKCNSFNILNSVDENTKVCLVKDEILKELCETNNPQGIIAVVDNKKISIEDKNGFYILIDKVQDPGNMGTIIRSANASGALGVIVTKGTVDIYNDKTLRSTMGSIFKIPIIEDNDFEVINDLKSKGFKLIVSSLDTENNFFDIDLTKKVIICVGNEGNGVSDEVYNLGDERVKIPMPGDAESLNVGVAASIMMYEVVRQNHNNQ
ncbi:RNA methyltransferase [Clostridium novyi A str. 4570]|uniref:RNA methyltransferase n=1 Tax=Clostridium novyi A str. 4570 TaxID=1444290 RepID=A0AA88ZRV8_CLONO|nr:RNA methyltransferase [Clostridium novyi]KGN03537.1 RNA methyltransferase [Clostridium novyi A str. 4570]